MVLEEMSWVHLLFGIVGGLCAGAIAALGYRINFGLQNRLYGKANISSVLIVWVVAILSSLISIVLLFYIGVETILREGVTMLEVVFFSVSGVLIFLLAVRFKFIPERIEDRLK